MRALHLKISILFDQKFKQSESHYTYTEANEIFKKINIFCCWWIFSCIYQARLLSKSEEKKYWTFYRRLMQ